MESAQVEMIRALVYAHRALGGTSDSPNWKDELIGIMNLIAFVARQAR